MTIQMKLDAIHKLMEEQGLDAYLIPSSDPHMSECPPKHWEARSAFSGFNGSAGTLVFTREKSALWADGRYHLQAERQIAGTDILLMRQGKTGVPSIEKWLAEELPEVCTIGFDGMTNSVLFTENLLEKLDGKQVTLRSIDLVTPLWEDRPARPETQAFLLEDCYAGKSAVEKLAELHSELKNKKADAMLVMLLDSLAWLLNIRAHDIDYTPYLLAYCLVTEQSVTLFTELSRLPEDVQRSLEQSGICLCAYDEVLDVLNAVSEPVRLLLDKESMNYDFWHAMEANTAITLVEGSDPIQHLKAIKNETEIQNLIKSHEKDGVAMVRFQRELEARMARGEVLDEMDISALLHDCRAEQPLFVEESFCSIVAYGANAAMMHYHPTKEACSVLQPKGFLLTDCGGQYLDGTTDITRTFALGELTDTERKYYTLSLKSHIGLARAVFQEGCTGANLDILSRIHLWRHGLDYRCGTGHGVSFLGGVHEGPQGLRLTNQVKFEAGMIITDEPGIYEEGVAGMRTENELVCRELMETEYGKFLHFEPITFAPIDLTPVLPELLDAEEINYLNDYHALVVEHLTPYLSQEELAWLKEKCAPLAAS